jgi:hypothetical protein
VTNDEDNIDWKPPLALLKDHKIQAQTFEGIDTCFDQSLSMIAGSRSRCKRRWRIDDKSRSGAYNSLFASYLELTVHRTFWVILVSVIYIFAQVADQSVHQ